MTEEEAKTKWCPQVRLAADGHGEWHTSRDPSMPSRPDDTQAYRCLASDCMAWRTRHQWLDNAQETPDWVSYAPYAFEPGPGQERDDGYCGLFGEPR